jgi:hypothetical protein
MVSTARECINDFSALSITNVRTGPEMNVRDHHFELKLGLIKMVQESLFCGNASEESLFYS